MKCNKFSLLKIFNSKIGFLIMIIQSTNIYKFFRNQFKER